MHTRTMPTQQFLREAFDYDPVTGNVTWRVRPHSHFATKRAWNTWNGRFPGRTAASTSHRFGHPQTCITAQNWQTHRLIWKWMTGDEPPQIDHLRDPTDNSWANLRAATSAGNNRNRRRIAVTKTGFKGVYPTRGASTFSARIRINGKPTHLGSFRTAEEAHAAYCAAAQEHFGEFWNPG